MTAHPPVEVAVTFNMIVILDFLGEGDLQTGRRLNESLQDMQHPKRHASIFYGRIECLENFVQAIETVRAYCERGNTPILHIEAHGAMDLGLEISTNGQRLSWEFLAEGLLRLNTVCPNNLAVILAACEGIYLARQMKWNKPSQFHVLIAPMTPVRAGDAEKDMLLFYATLFKTMSLDLACASIAKNFKAYYALMHFREELSNIYREHFIGSKREAQKELQLSQMMRNTFVKNALGVKKLREIAKTVVTPSAKRYEDQSKLFFHGHVLLPFEYFMAYVRARTDEQQ